MPEISILAQRAIEAHANEQVALLVYSEAVDTSNTSTAYKSACATGDERVAIVNELINTQAQTLEELAAKARVALAALANDPEGHWPEEREPLFKSIVGDILRIAS